MIYWCTWEYSDVWTNIHTFNFWCYVNFVMIVYLIGAIFLTPMKLIFVHLTLKKVAAFENFEKCQITSCKYDTRAQKERKRERKLHIITRTYKVTHTYNNKPHYLPKQIQTTSEVQPLTITAKKWLLSLNAFQKCLSGPVGWDPACFALGGSLDYRDIIAVFLCPCIW